jgi:tRNA1(Val) A37 N6-methylase TrmN6
MMPSTKELPGLNPSAALFRIRDVLQRAAYDEAPIRELLGSEWPSFSRRRTHRQLYRHRTRGGSARDALLRLFCLADAVAADAVSRAIAPTSLDDWLAAGLLRRENDQVAASVELCPYHDLVLAADWPTESSECVMPVAASSRALAQFLVPRPSTLTLDMGCGCGVLALRAAAHSERVIGVDSNPRAAAFSSFNAQLNGITNVEFHAGDFFSHASELAFDLIVCNPPFVISPRAELLHTDSGQPGDALCRDLARQAPAYLRDGGYFQMVCNWAHIRGEDWRQRLAEWCTGTGCDAWSLHFHSVDVATYASDRLAETGTEASERDFQDWLAYYERERIEAIGFGLLTMRRTTRAAPWFRCDTAFDVKAASGATIHQAFVLREFLETHSDDRALLDARVRTAPGLRWERAAVVASSGWETVESRLLLPGALVPPGNAAPQVLDVLARCGQAGRLRELLDEAAKAVRQTPDQLAPAFLAVVRRFIEIGYLLPLEAVES